MHLVNSRGGADWYAACPCGWRSYPYRNQKLGEGWAKLAGEAHAAGKPVPGYKPLPGML
jgi:hypothetical protein